MLLSGKGEAAPPVVMGYYPEYHTFPSVQALRFDRFTHIVRSFVSVDGAGELVASPQLTDATLVSAAHAKGTKVLLALGGGSNGENFGLMVRSSEKRAKFIANLVQLMSEGNFDGLAIDWEQPEARDKEVTTAFVSELRTRMKAARPESTLVLVVNALAYASQGYDGPKLRDHVDYLHVMSYDFHGPWSHAGHHASLFESKADPEDGALFTFPASLSYWRDVQGFRTGQILLGLAGYGRGFKARAWGEKGTVPSRHPEITFRELRALVGQGWSRQWDAEAHAPWLLNDDGTERISYDDEQSVADKAVWMKRSGLPGFFIWELTQEYVDGDNLLTAAAQKAWETAE